MVASHSGPVLLTGASGFLGSKLAEALVRRGVPLRLMLRTPHDANLPMQAERVWGDVTDAASVKAAAAGCSRIIHAAALVKMMAPAEDFSRTNVGGLANVLDAARATAAEHVVYVSSFMALGPTEALAGGVGDEHADVRAGKAIKPLNRYQRSKIAAEAMARAAQAEGTPLSIAYPAVIYGPGPLTAGNLIVRLILNAARGKLMGRLGSPERRWCYVYVDDVAAGIAALLDRPPGGRYVLGGENVSHADFFVRLEAAGGIRVPRWRVPDFLARLAGRFEQIKHLLWGAEPLLTPDVVDVYGHDWAYSSKLAEVDLGYRYRSLAEGFEQTLLWLRETGELPPLGAPGA